jgi:hypothetical protein
VCISTIVSPIVYPALSLLFYASDMSPKKKAGITDRATANKAKAYVYGVKEMRKLAAVKKTNKYIDIESSYSEKNEQSNRNTSYITITRALTVVVRLTLLVLYLYMVWSFIIN